ncbi:glucokinase [Gallaecimonas kandeliae]|uniref:glucokinase n=1 Tax=Gallaecimonas kandeliae TaxID=3029055 RepID=UPI0026492374|nr:glucokinase [Gallaecimonas kandeliae]WKE65197.1 glucokinase [Gallaecimonas kandeliae]
MVTKTAPFVVADIGGTNARFGLVVGKDGDRYEIVAQERFPSGDFADMQALVAHYLALVAGHAPKHVCLAVAGPVGGDQVHLTNLGWHFSISELKESLGLEQLEVINDFVAYANSIPLLPAEAVVQVRSGQAVETAPIAVLGPGTGLGVACLVPSGKGWNAIGCEGGHIALGAATERQRQVLNVLAQQLDFVSAEKVLSGSGLPNLYRAVATLRGETPRDLSAADISELALDGEPTCFETLSLFCEWLGGVASDIALAQGARGGLYLGGGILPRFLEFFLKSDFVKGFTQKGVMTGYLSEIPVFLAIETHSALTGAAAWLDSHKV